MTFVPQLRQSFKKPALLDQALTHRSWINENPGIRGTNERLEFLGDAVLEFVVSAHIYTQFPDKEEGYLTALRASLVNTQNLCEVAKKLNIGEFLYLSKGEDEGGGRDNSSLLADTIEAIIGALYIDQGFEAAENFITNHILTTLDEKIKEPLKDAKSRLQEKVQAKGEPTPKYKVVEESGPDHAKTFVVEVCVGSKMLGRGTGKSKSEAEQDAARLALEGINL
jgi:ribonuclease-3